MRRTLIFGIIGFFIVSSPTGSQTPDLDRSGDMSDGEYRLKWHVVPSGGAMGAANGDYSLSSTAGQTDIFSHTNTDYSLASGFWNDYLIDLYTVVETEENIDDLPITYQLRQNFPNPFNPQTMLTYALPEESDVVLEIYDLLGRRVCVLKDGTQEAGYYSVQWDGRDAMGNVVGAGVYVYRISARGSRGRDFVRSRKMLFVK